MKYVWKMKVSGRLSFPLDMLRYDACWPDTSIDVDSIHHSLDPQRERKTWTATVMKRSETAKESGFTIGRWNSFGISCEPPKRVQ